MPPPQEIRLNITRERARGLINRLVHEPKFREQFEADTLAVLSEYGIEVSPESLPNQVRLPEAAAIQAFLSLLETRIAPEPASPFGAAVVVLAFGAMPVLDGTG
jgi:hypothetical protein